MKNGKHRLPYIMLVLAMVTFFAVHSSQRMLTKIIMMQVQPTRDNDSHEPQEAILGVAATPASAENIAEAQGVPAEEKGGPIDIDVIELFEPDVSSNNTSAIAFTNFRLPAIEEDNTESPSTVASTKAYRNQTNSVASSTALVFDKTTSRNNATPNGTGGPHRRNITMVAHLRGKMGNNLSVLAHAYAVKLAIERAFPNISITLVGQHQDAPKWKSAARNLQTCFPSLRDFQFNGGRWMKEYRIRLEQQTIGGALKTSGICFTWTNPVPVGVCAGESLLDSYKLFYNNRPRTQT
jgi:hypothetical protein